MPFYVENGYPVFTGTDGLPLENGYIFIGVENLNPLSNPQEAFWDEALTIPAVNIRTKGGYAVYKGSPARIHTENQYSILVQDENRNTVYYQPTSVDPGTSGSASGETVTSGVPVGGVLPHNGVTFPGYFQLGTENLIINTYSDLFNVGVDFVVNNGDGTFSLLDSGYDTGWVANSDWTDATLTIIHNLSKGLPELDVEVFVSSLGSNATAIKLIDTSYDLAAAAVQTQGATIRAIGDNSFAIQTGTNGVDLIDSDGTKLTLAAQSWFYRVVVQRRDMPYPAQVKALETVQGFTLNGDVPIGMSLPYPIPDSPPGFLPWQFNNAVSKVQYAELYAVVGDVYEAQHVAAGDPASGDDRFYPTPVPGEYTRTALPDVRFTDAEVDTVNNDIDNTTGFLPTTVRDGTPYTYQAVSGTEPTTSPQIASGTTYYITVSATGIALFPTEADAIAGTNQITISAAGSGSFKLTQQGLTLSDAAPNILEEVSGDTVGVDGSADGSGADVVVTTGVGNATDRLLQVGSTVSNEVRPSTVLQYMHIKAQTLVSASTEEPEVVNGNIVGDIIVRGGNVTPPSATVPRYCFTNFTGVDKPDAAVWPDLVPWFRSQKLIYLEGTASEVSEFAGSGDGVDTITLATNTANEDLMAVLAEFTADRGQTVPYSDFMTVDFEGVTYEVLEFDAALLTIRVDGVPPNTGGNVTIYPHRIAGSTTTARVHSAVGKDLRAAGTTEYLAGLMWRDQFQSARFKAKFSMYASSQSDRATVGNGQQSIAYGRGDSVGANFLTNSYPKMNGFDFIDNARTGSTTRGAGMGVHYYYYAKRYIAPAS